MLVLQGVNARELLAHGIYQASLKSDIKGKDALTPVAKAGLAEIIQAIEPELPRLEAAADQAVSAGTIANVSVDAAVLLAEELKDTAYRLVKIRELVREWKAALARA